MTFNKTFVSANDINMTHQNNVEQENDNGINNDINCKNIQRRTLTGKLTRYNNQFKR